MSTLLVYDLHPPGETARYASAIRRALGAGGLRLDGDLDFHVSPMSGAFRAFDDARLAAPVDERRLAEDHESARASSAAFLRRAKAAWDAERKRAGTPRPDVFPLAHLRHLESLLWIKGETKRPVHWLVRWGLELPTGRRVGGGSARSERVPVRGARIETRIGPDGQVLSVTSTLRTWTGIRRVEAWDPPADDHENEEAPMLLYENSGAEEEQRHWAPMWLLPLSHAHSPEEGGHPHGVPFHPATALSLIVAIAWEPMAEGVQLEVLRRDRDGAMRPIREEDGWAVQWRWLSFPGSSGLKQRAGDRLPLDRAGAYHASAEVESLRTGAYASSFLELPVAVPRPARRAQLV